MRAVRDLSFPFFHSIDDTKPPPLRKLHATKVLKSTSSFFPFPLPFPVLQPLDSPPFIFHIPSLFFLFSLYSNNFLFFVFWFFPSRKNPSLHLHPLPQLQQRARRAGEPHQIRRGSMERRREQSGRSFQGHGSDLDLSNGERGRSYIPLNYLLTQIKVEVKVKVE